MLPTPPSDASPQLLTCSKPLLKSTQVEAVELLERVRGHVSSERENEEGEHEFRASMEHAVGALVEQRAGQPVRSSSSSSSSSSWSWG